MAQILLRFVNSEDFIGRGIDWVTNSYMDHVEFGTPENTWIGAHLEGGIQERPYDYLKPSWEHRYGIPCSDEQAAGVIADARAGIGTVYNTLDIVGLFLHIRHLTSSHAEICSQFVTEVCWKNGIYLLNIQYEFAHLITPRDVHLSRELLNRQIPERLWWTPNLQPFSA